MTNLTLLPDLTYLSDYEVKVLYFAACSSKRKWSPFSCTSGQQETKAL